MKNLISTFLLISLCTIAFSQYNSSNLKPDLTSGSKYTYGNLRLYPVRANEVFLALHKHLGNYTVLADAVSENKLIITEVSSSGTVNTLYAENVSKDSIYVMAGEIVKGGKQDRVIAQDFILGPGQKIDVGAFCVEHGRWSAGSEGGLNNIMLNESYSEEDNLVGVMIPEFKETAKVVSADVRGAAIVKKNQTQVWEKVEEVTTKNDAVSGTGTYNALENSKEYQDTLRKYLDYFSEVFIGENNIIGFVAVTGNKIIGTDLFATNGLFIDQYHNLPNSYITEAITNGTSISIQPVEVQKYLDEFLSDESLQKSLLDKEGAQFKHNGFVLHCVRF